MVLSILHPRPHCPSIPPAAKRVGSNVISAIHSFPERNEEIFRAVVKFKIMHLKDLANCGFLINGSL